MPRKASASRNRHLAIYGNVSIERARCSACNDMAFVFGGKSACCGAPTEDTGLSYKRMSEPQWCRKGPPRKEKLKILEEQDGKCAYCDRRLGSYVRREGKLIRLVTNWDHFLPYSMTANNYGHNFVAACHICNGIKSSKVFQTLEEAREHVVSVAWAKGISDA